MIITSRQNSFIKEIRALADKKNRDKTGGFIAEGVKMVKEASSIKSDDVLFVVGLKEKLDLIDIDEAKKIEVTDQVFSSITTEVSPEGVLAVIKKPENKLKSPVGKCLFLDGVSDPANVGAIIRTAVSAGFTDVYCYKTADPFSPKSVRASMGGIYRANIISGEREDLLSVIDKPFIVADMNGQNAYDFKIDTDFCLVIGNEANGVSNELRNKANFTVSIPMQNGMESLNASVSAGILMYLLR